MPLDPNIIMSGPRGGGVDVNALYQQQMQGMENINQMERQRKADALAMQDRAAKAAKEQEAAAIKALLPAYIYGIQTGDIVGAGNLAPPEMRGQLQQFIDALADKSPQEVQAALIGSLASSPEGREALAAIQRAQTAQIQQGQLDVSRNRLAFDTEQAAAEAARGPEPSYKEVVLDDGTLVLMDTKSGKIIQPSMTGPIDTAVPPQEDAPKPLKVKQKDGANTESERLAAYNSGRVLQAAQDIVSAVQTDPSALSPGTIEAAVGNVANPNVVRSAERQQVVSAQRELIDALLTLATGAAYNREQREGQIEGFIPVWSDKPAQVKSKLNRTLKTIEIAKVKSGRAWTPEMDAAFQQLLLTFGDSAGAGAGGKPAPAADASGFEFLGTEPEE